MVVVVVVVIVEVVPITVMVVGLADAPVVTPMQLQAELIRVAGVCPLRHAGAGAAAPALN